MNKMISFNFPQHPIFLKLELHHDSNLQTFLVFERVSGLLHREQMSAVMKTTTAGSHNSQFWLCWGDSYIYIHGHGYGGRRGKRAHISKGRSMAATPRQCSGNTGWSQDYRCTMYGSNPGKGAVRLKTSNNSRKRRSWHTLLMCGLELLI